MANAGSGDEGTKARGDRTLHQVPLAGPSPWLAQEFLGAFEGDLGEVALVPAAGGVFMIWINEETVWDRRAEGFPERAAVKRGVRDRAAPGRDTDRSDRQDAQEH